jgi:hypothetical protein
LGSGGGDSSESSVSWSSGGVGDRGRSGAVRMGGDGDCSRRGEGDSGREQGTAGGGEMGRNRQGSSFVMAAAVVLWLAAEVTSGS